MIDNKDIQSATELLDRFMLELKEDLIKKDVSIALPDDNLSDDFTLDSVESLSYHCRPQKTIADTVKMMEKAMFPLGIAELSCNISYKFKKIMFLQTPPAMPFFSIEKANIGGDVRARLALMYNLDSRNWECVINFCFIKA